MEHSQCFRWWFASLTTSTLPLHKFCLQVTKSKIFFHLLSLSCCCKSMMITYLIPTTKGGFYSEGTDVFVRSPNRWTKLFFWTWILKFCQFKKLKSCHIRLHFAIWAFSEASGPLMRDNLSPLKWLIFKNSRSGKTFGSSAWRNDKRNSTFWIKATFRTFQCSRLVLTFYGDCWLLDSKSLIISE